MDESRTQLSVGKMVGENLRDLARELGLTQEETAERVRLVGLEWTHDNVRALETGRRDEITLGELVLLSVAFEVPLARWFKDFKFPGYRWGEDHGPKIVELARAGVFVKPNKLQQLLQGAPAKRGNLVRRTPTLAGGPAISSSAIVPAPAYSRAEVRAAASLGAPLQDIRIMSQRIWAGRALDQERDRRLGDQAPSSRAALRGHVTRQLLSELRRGLQ